MIINIIPNNWYNFPEYFIEALANGSHDDELKHLLEWKTLKEVDHYRHGEISSFRKYVEYLIFTECLESWQHMFGLPIDEDGWCNFDGYSQVKNSFSSEPDYQAFGNEHYLVVVVSLIYNGIGVLINRHNGEITLFGIHEDDGHWFVGTGIYEPKLFNYLKNFLMSQISELRIENFDHQEIIEKIWNAKYEDIQNEFLW